MSLYIVATPIGNLKDITQRALDVLRSSDAIACEDTRVTSKLLTAYEISKPLLIVHAHSSPREIDRVINLLSVGKDVAYVTDAGTPCISDPGGKLVAQVVSALGPEIKIIPVPGASAITSALSVSGFPADKFVFLGFRLSPE